jgi:zinc protease
MQEELGRRLYPGQWSRKNITGERSVLQSVTPERMREIQRKYYVPNNTALIVTGAVTAQRVFELAEAILGDWPRGADPFKTDPIPPIPALTASDAVIVEEPVSAVTVLIQWQGPSVGKDPGATYAADVFSDVLNTATSKLQQRLVDTGLWHGIGVNYYTLDQVGPITISGQTSPNQLRQALTALEREIEQLADSGYITQEELVATKAERSVSTAFGLDRASEFAHTLGFWWSVAGLEYYLGYVDNMAKQTLTDLRAYARKYIVGKHRVVGVLIDPGARRAINLTREQLLPRVIP